MAGMGWWTTDIGGFYEGHGATEEFQDLLVRWFEFGVFSPICRLHGFRVPDDVPPPALGEPVTYGQDTFNIFTSNGGSNEVWSFGGRVEGVLTELLALRERLRPYIGAAFANYSKTGDPVMAPLFYHFPDQPDLRDRGDAYIFGPDMLVAPILEAGAEARDVALPTGETWIDAWTGTEHPGGPVPKLEAPWGRIPVLVRKEAHAALGALFRSK